MSKFSEGFYLSKALRLRIGDDGKLYGSISHSSGDFYIAPEVLSILCQISAAGKQLELKKISKNLGIHYKNILDNLPDTKECESILNDLIASGLVISAQKNTSRYLQEDGFGDFWIQWAMLSDRVRCASYEKSIQKLVTKKSVVVDVGAGSGFLTAACLKAGAKKVIAIEETQIAKKIIPLLNELKLPIQNGKLSILNQNSFDVPLPCEVTHVVSELFGNDPFQEGVIPTLRNIGLQFKSQPTYIPLKVFVYFELVDISEHPIKHRIKSVLNHEKRPQSPLDFTQEFLSAAKNCFRFQDISFPLALSKNNFKRVAKPIKFGQLPLNPPLAYLNKKSHPLFGQQKIKVTESGSCIVGLIWYRVYLTESITISSHPQEQDAAEHWSPIIVVLNKHLNKTSELNIFYGLNELENQIECGVYLDKLKIGGRGDTF